MLVKPEINGLSVRAWQPFWAWYEDITKGNKGGNRHFAQIDATTRIAAKVFVVIRKNTLHYLKQNGGYIYE